MLPVQKVLDPSVFHKTIQCSEVNATYIRQHPYNRPALDGHLAVEKCPSLHVTKLINLLLYETGSGFIRPSARQGITKSSATRPSPSLVMSMVAV